MGTKAASLTPFFLLAIVIISNVDGFSTRQRCISACQNKKNLVTLHQSCESCSKFVMCFKGEKTEMDCGTGLYWDDQEQECVQHSTTCVTPRFTNSTSKCFTTCTNKSDGYFKACDTCEGYVECRRGNLIKRPCPRGTLYNDNFKQCSATSNTCITLEAGGDNGCIIDSCANRQDGVYQLCTTCRWYARCKNGNLVPMPCPAEMLWDDARKYCVHTKHCVLSE